VFDEMPGAHMMFTEEEGTTFMNDMIGSGDTSAGGADVQADEDEIEETIEVVDADTGKRKLRGPAADTHHSKWKSLEDARLIESWKTVSLDPITGANQTLGK
jgi:hypothetical protein